jgi:arylsulfate sulfotransferase
MVALIALTLGCGTSTFNDPPGIASTAVASTANPLVAQVTMTTALGCPGQVAVQFGTDTTYGRTTAWYPASAASQTTTILVAGMRPSTTYHLQPMAQQQCASSTTPSTFNAQDTTFTTGPLPTAVPFPAASVSRPAPSPGSPENPGIEEIDIISNGSPAYFTDRDANTIWYYDVGAANYTETFKLLPSGHMILSIIQTSGPALLREIDLAGNTIREMDIAALGAKMQAAGWNLAPQIYHHDLLPLANGHLIILTNFIQNFTDLPGYPGVTGVIGDGIVDLDENWNPVWVWNSFDHLDVNRHLNGLPDWTHSNALQYTADGNLLLSMRHQSWVIKIDYNNSAGAGDILWKLGYEGDFTLAQGTDPSLWFSFQHYPNIISQVGSQTTLAIWDNGNARPLDTNGDVCGAPNQPLCYSRSTLFQLDENALSANLIWADTPGYFDNWGGSINQLTNGNVEFDINAIYPPPQPNIASEVQEVTQTSSPQIVWKMDITPTANPAYRAYRVPSLYPGVTWQY